MTSPMKTHTAVPNTYAQSKTGGGMRRATITDRAPEPTELQLLQATIAQMRLEAQASDVKIEQLEVALAEHEAAEARRRTRTGVARE